MSQCVHAEGDSGQRLKQPTMGGLVKSNRFTLESLPYQLDHLWVESPFSWENELSIKRLTIQIILTRM